MRVVSVALYLIASVLGLAAIVLTYHQAVGDDLYMRTKLANQARYWRPRPPGFATVSTEDNKPHHCRPEDPKSVCVPLLAPFPEGPGWYK